MFSVNQTDKTEIVDNVNIRYWDAGSSDNIVIMIHGLGGSSEQWFANVTEISLVFRVICIDMPGCGKTDPLKNGDYSLGAISRLIDKFVMKLGLDSFSLVGLSMGGAVCLRYTLDHPEKVRKLVLAGSAGLGDRMAFIFRALTIPGIDRIPGLLSRNQFSYFVRSMVYDPSVITNEIIDFYYMAIKTECKRTAFLKMLKASCSISGIRKMVHDGVVERLPEIEQKVLIIWGRQDHFMPFANVMYASKKIRNVQVELLDNCKHNPQFEKSEEFNRIVCNFLKS